MRNLFLLFTCVVMVILLKELPKKKEQIKRIDVKKSHIIDFSGTLFLPKTLQADAELVNSNFIIISISGKNYRYEQKLFNYQLNGEAKELPVSPGDKIVTSFPTRLFFAKELK